MNERLERAAHEGLDLRALGVAQVAYIKPTAKDGQPLFAIHGADGQLLGMSPTWRAAASAVLEHSMELVPLH